MTLTIISGYYFNPEQEKEHDYIGLTDEIPIDAIKHYLKDMNHIYYGDHEHQKHMSDSGKLNWIFTK